MPDIFLPYAKAWAAFIVAVLTGVSVVVDLPQWLTIALAALSVIAVYGVRNTPAPDGGEGAGDVEDDGVH